MLSNFPPLHPAIVHFPVALLLLTGLFGLISLFSKRELWKNLMIYSLIGGIISSPFAVVTGFIEEQKMKHAGVDEMLMLHKYNGLAIIFFFQFLFMWYWLRKLLMRNKEYKFWVICLLLGSCLVLLQGYLGGELVFSKGMGVKPVEEAMGSSSGNEHGGGGKKSEGHDKKGMDNTKGKDDMKDMEGMDNTKEKGDNKHEDDTKDKKDMDSKKGKDDMKEMGNSDGKDTYIINGNFYQYNMKDKDKVNDMKSMDNSKSKDDMKDMNSKKGKDDMKGMKKDDRKDMKDMKNMGGDKKNEMNGMKGMHISGIEMKSPPDTFKFKDNNPAWQKTKKEKK